MLFFIIFFEKKHFIFPTFRTSVFAGDQCHRAGLPPAATHGLPEHSAPAHAGLLAEGPQRATPLH